MSKLKDLEGMRVLIRDNKPMAHGRITEAVILEVSDDGDYAKIFADAVEEWYNKDEFDILSTLSPVTGTGVSGKEFGETVDEFIKVGQKFLNLLGRIKARETKTKDSEE